MRKKQELDDPTSCLNNSRLDEPLFVLCARDPAAAPTVREWARRYVKAKGGKRKLTDRQRRKVQEAFDLADLMDRWALDNGYIEPTGKPTGKN